MPLKDDPLDLLRRDIDRIDDAIHDLLMERTAAVREIARIKDRDASPIYRPAREAAILRRLAARHKGAMPVEVVIRVWREIIAAMVRLEGSFAVAAFAPGGESGYVELARQHFGALTSLAEYGSTAQVLAAVTQGKNVVGVLPLPGNAGGEAWWRNLRGKNGAAVRIVARLPFGGHSTARGRGVDALVVAGLTPESTGHDRSYALLETAGELSRASLKTLLEQAGFVPHYIEARADGGTWIHLVEVEGFVAAADERLAAIAAKAGAGLNRAEILGAYAVPLGEAELGAGGSANSR